MVWGAMVRVLAFGLPDSPHIRLSAYSLGLGAVAFLRRV